MHDSTVVERGKTVDPRQLKDAPPDPARPPRGDKAGVAAAPDPASPEEARAQEAAGLKAKRPRSWVGRLFRGRQQDKRDQSYALRETVTISEVVALVHHVVETGCKGTERLAARLDRLLTQYARSRPGNEKEELHVEILKGYAALTAITNANGQGVNGRTLKSSQHIVGDLWIVGICGLLSFSLVAFTHILGNFYGDPAVDNVPSGEGAPQTLYQLYKYVLVFLLPAFWGALGATISLTMKIAERARNNTFDSRKLRGQLSRIGLGAALAVSIVHLFGAVMDLKALGLGSNGIAFLVGLGVKAIYGAFEVLVERISEAIEKLHPKRHAVDTRGG